MEEQFLDRDHSKMLKELGFDEECLASYEINEIGKFGEKIIPIGFQICNKAYRNSDFSAFVTAPTLQQAEQWIFDKHEIFITVIFEWNKFGATIYKKSRKNIICHTDPFNSPITAKNEGIKKAIEYLYEQSKK